MAKAKLATDVTVEAIVAGLNKPVDYVRKMFGNMHDFKREYGAAYVRLGTTGRGLAPHYRIEPAPDRLAFLGEIAISDDDWGDTSKYFLAFNGLSHQKMEWGAAELKGAHWSSAYTAYDDVQSLLGRLRRPVQS